MDLQEHQFEILPSAEAEEGVGFGIGLDVSIDDGGFRPGSPEWVTQDSVNGIDGTTSFGRDHLTGPTWSWALHLNRENTSGALETLRQLARAWRAKSIRDTPGEVVAIRYHLGNRTRRVFGRPGRFEGSPDNMLLNGFMPISCDFKLVDEYIYDDLESYITPSLMPLESEGGFRFPARFPVQTLPVNESYAQAVVDGDGPTYPIIRFDGPITNPSLETADWGISLNLNIGAGEFVTIDTRPWVRSVMFMGTTSVAGALGKRQWLANMSMEPGNHDFIYRGTAGSGGATCEVRWRSAWDSI